MNSYIALTKDKDIKLINDKINWWCFFFGPFWALYHGIWSLALILFTISSANILLINIFNVKLLTVEIFRILISSIVSLYANHFLAKKYIKMEYKMVDIICASDRQAAFQRFFDRNL